MKGALFIVASCGMSNRPCWCLSNTGRVVPKLLVDRFKQSKVASPSKPADFRCRFIAAAHGQTVEDLHLCKLFADGRERGERIRSEAAGIKPLSPFPRLQQVRLRREKRRC